MNDSIKAVGNLKIVKTNKDNVIVETREVPNLIVTVGKGMIANRLARDTGNVPESMAIGIDSTTPSLVQTGLLNEKARVSQFGSNVKATGTFTSGSSLFTNVVNSATVTYTGTFGSGVPGGTESLTEAAIFDSPNVGGTMLCRTTFSAVSKGPTDIVTITWNITIA